MAGYSRQSSADIQDGNIVEAQPINNEFNAIQAAFNTTSGHKHDGTAGEGAPITVIGPTRNVNASATALYPRLHNIVDLGTTDLRYKALFLSGAAVIGGAVTVTGNVTAANFIGNGSQLTGITDVNLPATIVRTSRTIATGNGLSGGGDLSANRTLSVVGGDGITVNGTGVNVDATVVRTTGTQEIGGAKTFTSSPTITASSIYQDGSGNLHHWFRSAAGTAQGLVYWDSGNSSIHIRAYDVDGSTVPANISIRRSGAVDVTGVISGNGSGLTNLNGSNISTGTVADARLPTTVVRTSRTVTAGNGLTGGGALSGNITLTVGAGDGITVGTTTVGVDSTVVRTSGNQSISGGKSFVNGLSLGDKINFTGNVGSQGNPPIDFGGANGIGYNPNTSLGVSIITNGTRRLNVEPGGNVSMDGYLEVRGGIGSTQGNVNLHSPSVGGNSNLWFREPDNTRRAVIYTENSAGNLVLQTYDAAGSGVATRVLMNRDGEFILLNGTYSGNGSGITSLNASNIGSGTIADARLPSTAVRTSRTISAGNGLNGGGNLGADRSFSVGAGDGIIVGSTTVAVDSSVVRTSGNQTIAGDKTFSNTMRLGSFISMNDNKIITLADPTNATDAANKRYVDDQAVGVGQTWQDVSGSRNPNTSYRNTTGRPIQVNIHTSYQGTIEKIQVSSNNSTWVNVGSYSGSSWISCSFIVPNNWYYRTSGSSATFSVWSELR